MELFTLQGAVAILQIMLIDILLAGDNAIVIGMAARNLPENLRKKAIFWGTFGAIALRLVMAFAFLEALNNIPALRLIGGVLLLWIGYSLLAGGEKEHNIAAKDNLRGAIMTIIVADGVMGIDNVLGVVGAANGHMELVAAGMLVTVPIIIWGSTLFIRLIERFPIILYIGGGILGWVGAGMITEDQLVSGILGPYHLLIGIACILLVVGGAITVNRWKSRRMKAANVTAE